jgi:hypothetical protein
MLPAIVKASHKSITAACEAAEAPQWNAFSASLTSAPGADSFPITSFTWIYLRTGSSDSARAAAMGTLLAGCTRMARDLRRKRATRNCPHLCWQP